MKKKLAYTLLIGAVLVVGYLNYFKDEREVKLAPKQIETLNATYQKDGYTIEGAKQIDKTETDETFFESGHAKIKDMEISGDNIYMDPEKNLKMVGNILGKSMNGWKFFTQEMDYTKVKDLLLTDKGVRALSEKGIEISGIKFKSNSKMDYMELTGDIKIKDGDTLISADRAEYRDNTKILTAEGNVVVKSVEEGKDVTAHLKNAQYNMETGLIESFVPFTVDYAGAELMGTYFRYDKNSGAFMIDKAPVIKSGDYTIHLAQIVQKGDSDMVDLVGKIRGTNGKNSFTGDNGTYDTATGILTINNFVDPSDEKMTAKARQGFYSKHDGSIYLLDGELIDRKTGDRTTADRIDIDKDTGMYTATGKVRHHSGDRLLSTDLMVYDKKSGDLTLPNPYDVANSDRNEIFSGKSGKYTRRDGLFKTPGQVTMKTPDHIMTGTDLVYDTGKDMGRIERDVVIRGTKNGSVATSRSALLKKGEYVDFLGDLRMKEGESLLTSSKGRYNLRDKNFYISQHLIITNPGYTMTGDSGSFNPESKKFKVNGAYLESDKKDHFRADRGEGDMNRRVINFYGNAKGTVNDSNGPVNFKGDLFTINLKENGGKYTPHTAVIKNNGMITKDNTTMVSDNLTYFFDSKTAKGDSTTRTTMKDAKGTTVMTSKSVDADLKSQTAVLRGNVHIRNVNDKNEVTTGTGSQGVLRGKQKEFELTGNPRVESEKAILTGDKIIYNTGTNKVKATGNVLIDYKKEQGAKK